MTSRSRSQCSTCIRFRSPLDTGLAKPTCAAFPGGIPDEIRFNALDHRRPVDGDGGLRWESDGRPFPEYAMAVAQ